MDFDLAGIFFLTGFLLEVLPEVVFFVDDFFAAGFFVAFFPEAFLLAPFLLAPFLLASCFGGAADFAAVFAVAEVFLDLASFFAGVLAGVPFSGVAFSGVIVVAVLSGVCFLRDLRLGNRGWHLGSISSRIDLT